MQSVYAMQQSHSDDILKEEKFLKDSIDKMYDLYVLNLQLLIQVQKLANKRIALSKKKILATKEELNPNTKFIDNRVINKLNESTSLSAYVELHELNYWELDSEYVRIILDELLNSELYENYINNPNDSYHIDSAFVVAFFKEIIAPNEKLADYFEDKMISWVDDIPFINTWVVKSLNKQKAQNPFILGNLYKDSEDKQFVSKLFQKTVLNQHTYEDDILKKHLTGKLIESPILT